MPRNGLWRRGAAREDFEFIEAEASKRRAISQQFSGKNHCVMGPAACVYRRSIAMAVFQYCLFAIEIAVQSKLYLKPQPDCGRGSVREIRTKRPWALRPVIVSVAPVPELVLKNELHCVPSVDTSSE